jgi:aspartyl-tRNA(Asn)/glutamyl-tRNA(Gln) amidotransferase subunit A
MRNGGNSVSAPSELHELSIAAAARQLASRDLSPVELTQACLARIEAVEPRVKAFVTIVAEQALTAARQAEGEIQQGRYRGPLHGIPVALKDLYDTAGIATTSSSRQREHYVPASDATVTTRLAEAGTILLGKTTTHEFAYGVVTPPTSNPWNLDHIPGGSSGGSGAALAAGECLGATGSDTGGSIRIPSAFCGVTGIKPTFGRVSKFGVSPLSYSLDHAGPMARTVRDCALLLGIMAGYDPRDRCSVQRDVPDYTAELDGGVQGLRFGVPTDYYFAGADPEVKAAVETAIQLLAAQGAEIMEVKVPYLELSSAIAWPIVFGEASGIHQGTLRATPELFEPDVRALLEVGEFISATTYVKAQRARGLLARGMQDTFATHDLTALLAPTLPVTAARHGQLSYNFGTEEPLISAATRLALPGNLTGLPALSVPCGFSSAGLPIGLQIIGRPFDEATVLRVGQSYEAATDWTTRRPGL